MTVTTCGERKPIPVHARGRHLVVDIHCHLGIPAADAIVRETFPGPPPGINDFTSTKSSEVNRAQFMAIGRTLNTLDQRLEDMDRLGIDVQAISPSPGQYFYFADPETGRDAARAVNDGMAAAVAQHPDRLIGMGTVPLQNVEMAIAEMQRCVRELDLRGIEISSNVNGKDFHAEEYRPFFAAAEELGILLFIHPLGFTHANRMSEYYFNNLIGNPLESTLAIGHLIFGGVLDRFPGLKICVAHGGGYMPGYWGRMDHGWRARADCSEHCRHAPSSYLRKLWLDTLVFDPDQLDSLVRTHGADRLCLGTDYPFDMSEPDPVGFHARLDERDQAKILGRNAADLSGVGDGAVTCRPNGYQRVNAGSDPNRGGGEQGGFDAMTEIARSAKGARYTLFLLFLANLFNVADRALLGIVVDPVKADLALSDTQMSIVSGFAFVVFNLVVGVFIAHWVDHGNRKRILTLGIALWSAATALTGLAQGFTSLTLARILVGVGEATAFPVAYSMIADLFAARDDRARSRFFRRARSSA
jgi:aminocarboxymuconate-semialdehyde decarboxylase